MKTLLLLLIAISLIAVEGSPQSYSSKEQILSTHPDQLFSLDLSGKKLLVAVENHGTRRIPRDVLSLWIRQGETYRLLNTVQAGIGSFDEPRTFTIDGYDFIYAPTLPAGSGGFVQEHIFWITPDDTSHAVEFHSASETYEKHVKPGRVVLNGGDKEFFIENGQMKFQFWLAHDEDPHCCPSAGAVTGTYKVVGKGQYDSLSRKYSGDLKIEVDRIEVDGQSSNISSLN